MQHAGRAGNVNVNAFSAYATGGAHAFAKPTARRAGSTAPAEGGALGEATSGETSASQGSEDEGSRERKTAPLHEGESEESFSARLRSQKDKDEEAEESEKKISLTEQECKWRVPLCLRVGVNGLMTILL